LPDLYSSAEGQGNSLKVCQLLFLVNSNLILLAEKLKGSKYGTSDSIDHITKRFDETTKRLFRDKKDLQFVPFGSPLDKDSSVGIRGGQLKLEGYVSEFTLYF